MENVKWKSRSENPGKGRGEKKIESVFLAAFSFNNSVIFRAGVSSRLYSVHVRGMGITEIRFRDLNNGKRPKKEELSGDFDGSLSRARAS